MNICIPVTEERGLDSPVNAHFGSAPLFVIVDTETGACRSIPNRNQHHGHGMCQPLAALAGESIDGLVVGGIGFGALSRLQAAGVRVFLAEQSTIREAIEAFKAGSLCEATPETACRAHGAHGHGPGDAGPHGHGSGGGGPHGPCHG